MHRKKQKIYILIVFTYVKIENRVLYNTITNKFHQAVIILTERIHYFFIKKKNALFLPISS